MITWAFTLIRLYMDITNSAKLLPKKRLFIIHGSMLSAYLILCALAQVLANIRIRTNNLNKKNIVSGIIDIQFDLESLLEVATFYLVVKMMLPLTKEDKETRSKF